MNDYRTSFAIRQAIGAASRLALAYAGVNPRVIWADHDNPENDEHVLLEIVEGARDAWRPLWRSRSNRVLPP